MGLGSLCRSSNQTLFQKGSHMKPNVTRRYVSRRQFLHLTAITATGVLAAACVTGAPAAAPAEGEAAATETAPAAESSNIGTREAGTLVFGYAQPTSVDH